MERIYFDNAATTPISKSVLEAMRLYLTEQYGNPSAVYENGSIAKIAMTSARRSVANLINATPEEIYFTGGGTVSDNWALIGIAESLQHKGNHIIISPLEHSAIIETCRYLELRGFCFSILPVNKYGYVDAFKLQDMITDRTILVSCMMANNEIGTIQPIDDIVRYAHERGVLVHTDAVQAFGHIPIDVKETQVDLLSASSHKLNGPKGVGLLYIKYGTPIKPFIHGGHQENNMYAGTENVAGIVGFGQACADALDNMESREVYETALSHYIYEELLKSHKDIVLNGGDYRLANNLNIRVPGVNNSELQVMLDLKGISVSTGSACNSGIQAPSRILKKIGLTDEEANESIRITISYMNTYEEADRFIRAMDECIYELKKN